MRVVKHWKTLPEEASQRGCGDFQNLTGCSPEQFAVGDPAVREGVELDDLQSCLPASAALCESVVLV